jgi:sulfur-oxidizing protein SoxY
MASKAHTPERRRWLGRLASLAAVLSGASAGAARAASEAAAQASSQKTQAFQATQALQALHDFSPAPQWSPSISLDMPTVVDDGAVVPITVTALLSDACEIRVLVDANPVPLALHASIPKGTDAFVSTRIRMSASGTVYAAVRTNAGWFFNAQHAQVSTGGCR